MNMRPPALDLPIMFVEAGIAAGGVAILERITLTLAAGAPTLLIGPNGAGKTTLLRAAMGLIPLTSGFVTWGGREASAPKQRAIVFQRPVMLRRSTAGNVRYALAAAGVPRAARAARTDRLLQEVGLAGLAQRPARRLSGGEQQRLALARASALEPEVLFLDEPTASLDPPSSRAVEGIVESIHASGTTIVMTTHSLAQAKRLADTVVFLAAGRVTECTDAARFFKAPRSREARTFIEGERL